MKNTGFSLVELLVVIAIMAVLAGVAVPVYSQYTKNAQEGVDESVIQEICHVADIEAAKIGKTVSEVKVTINTNGKVTAVDVFESGDTTIIAETASNKGMIWNVVSLDTATLKSDTYTKTAYTWTIPADYDWNGTTPLTTTVVAANP